MSEKEKLHLQIKELERKYELLASEVVTVDDVMKIAARVQKRHTVIKRT